jgi:alkylhydroperoxidase family enzyme
VKALLESDGAPKRHLQEEAREAGWEDEQILEAIAHVALATFGNLVTRAGDVPIDGSSEDSRLAQAA